MSLFLLFSAVSNTLSVLTAENLMDNVLEVYEDIDDYRAVVHTYEADSMDVSGSVFESQQPIVAFNIFFRKPYEHVVTQIGRSRYGVFRIELLSALGHMKDFELKLKDKDFLLGEECYVLEIIPPTTPNQLVTLWISPKNWTVLQFTIAAKSPAGRYVDFSVTQFKYAPTGRNRFLPTETRSFFPVSKQVLINRIGNYQINTGLSSAIFEQRQSEDRSK